MDPEHQKKPGFTPSERGPSNPETGLRQPQNSGAFQPFEKEASLNLEKKAPLEPSQEAGSSNPEGIRSKTSTRMFYEAQVEVIKKQLGSLEKIRHDLGLSQRKMGQLLLVDPSALTRWNRADEEAPPHIWRALQWYMALNEKIPGLTPQYFIGKDPQILHEKALQKIDEEKAQRQSLESDFEVLKRTQKEVQEKLSRDVHFHRRLSYFFALISLALAVYILSRL